MYRTINLQFVPKQVLIVMSLSCFIMTTSATADLTGDNISGRAVSIHNNGEIFDEVNDVEPSTEFINTNFLDLAYFMDVDASPFNRVKISVQNGDAFVPQTTRDTLWLVGDLDCQNDDGGQMPITVTALIPLPGNTLNVTDATPVGGDGFRIRTAPDQGVPAGGGTLCATFVIVTEDDLPGDVNGDGTVNLLDVAPFIGHVADGEYNLGADVNRDGQVNLLDVGPFIAALSG